jgi:hypothetical protein
VGVQFEFFRFRFHFEAGGPIAFPPGRSANMLRGAFGSTLREVACTPRCSTTRHQPDCAYARIFEPRTAGRGGPSGLAEWPRPFVFRTRHLDARTFQYGEAFSFDVHLFHHTNPPVACFAEALARLARQGLGPRREPATLVSVDQLDTGGLVLGRIWGGEKIDRPWPPCAVPLDANGKPAGSARVQFVTPTELKSANGLAGRPDFAVLFARIRDRLSTLRALYGPGPLDIDFRGMGERASRVEMTRSELDAVHAHRRSSRTGQTHPLGGFTGEAEYQGELTEFRPYLRAARWTGVGRQTVWGKGELHLVESSD